MFSNRSRQVDSKNVHLGNLPMTVGRSAVCGTGALLSKEYPCGIWFFRIYPRKKRPFLTRKNKIPQPALKALQIWLETHFWALRTKLSKCAAKMEKFGKKNPHRAVLNFATAHICTDLPKISGCPEILWELRIREFGNLGIWEFRNLRTLGFGKLVKLWKTGVYVGSGVLYVTEYIDI